MTIGGRDLVDDDPDDPIVWLRSKLLPCGRYRVMYIHRSEHAGLIAAFGQDWVDAYLSSAEADLGKWGIH
jgi:hypothetical protein